MIKGIGLALGLAGTSGFFCMRRTAKRLQHELYPALRFTTPIQQIHRIERLELEVLRSERRASSTEARLWKTLHELCGQEQVEASDSSEWRNEAIKKHSEARVSGFHTISSLPITYASDSYDTSKMRWLSNRSVVASRNDL